MDASGEFGWLVRVEKPEGFGGHDIAAIVSAKHAPEAIVKVLSGFHGGDWAAIRVSCEMVSPV